VTLDIAASRRAARRQAREAITERQYMTDQMQAQIDALRQQLAAALAANQPAAQQAPAGKDMILATQKLNNDNWPIWKVQVRRGLAFLGDIDLISGAEAEPAQDSPSRPAYVARSNHVMFLIGKVLDTPHQVRVMDAANPKQLWDILTHMHEGNQPKDIFRLSEKLANIQFRDFPTMERFLGEIQLISSQLSARGHPIDEKALIVNIFSKLKSSAYSAIVVSLTIGPAEALTMTNVMNILIDQAKEVESQQGFRFQRGDRFQQGSHRGQQQRQAAFVSSQGHPRTTEQGRRSGACFNCGRMGHYANKCRAPKNNQRNGGRNGGGNDSYDGRQQQGSRTQSPSSQGGHVAHHAFYSLEAITTVNDVTCSDADEAIPTASALVSRHSVGPVDPMQPQEWWIDSGCSNHMTGATCMLTHCRAPPIVTDVTVGTGEHIAAEGIATAVLSTCFGALHLKDVLHVPSLKANLVSVSQACDNGVDEVVFTATRCEFRRGGQVIAGGTRHGKLYRLDVAEPRNVAHLARDSASTANVSVQEAPVEVTHTPASTTRVPLANIVKWHERLGHLNYQTIRDMEKAGFIRIDGDSSSPSNPCPACATGKFARKTISKTATNRSSRFGRTLIYAVQCKPDHIRGRSTSC
jgi:hypothetical protein